LTQVAEAEHRIERAGTSRTVVTPGEIPGRDTDRVGVRVDEARGMIKGR